MRPTLPETFVASGEVEVHQADFTGFGECKFYLRSKLLSWHSWPYIVVEIARNEAAQMGLEKENYNGVGRDEVSDALYRYDMNKTYYLRG